MLCTPDFNQVKRQFLYDEKVTITAVLLDLEHVNTLCVALFEKASNYNKCHLKSFTYYISIRGGCVCAMCKAKASDHLRHSVYTPTQ